MFEPGDIIENQWEVLGPLDTGSTSVVFRGRDVADSHAVAIKVLRPDTAGDPIAVQRCLREARLMQTLGHPNIVRVEGSGVSPDGRPYMVMELLVGETLEARILKSRIERDRVPEIIAQVGAAIDAAHAAGIVHRDLKPDNVFLLASDDGRLHLKILDFGFARQVVSEEPPDGFRTETNALLGTPLYMAPEQIRASRDVDHRADLWSLGVMAYELLVGAPPFRARSVVDLFVEILSAPIPAPSSHAEDLRATVDAWAAHALDRVPARRFQSGKALADSLAAALAEKPTELAATVPPPAVAAAKATVTRAPSIFPARWLWVAVVLAALLVGLLAVMLRSR